MNTRAPLFAVLCLIFVTHLNAQELLHITNGCHYDGDDTAREIYTYAPSQEVQEILERITSVMSLEPNFILKSANVRNALATTERGQRYILYSTTFLENFKRDARTQWAAYSVLAHEIGHHLSNHDLGETDLKQRKLQEIQADKFAGGVMYRLRASLEQAQAGINTFSLNEEAVTHPPKSARLEAVAAGWNQAKELSPQSELITEEDEIMAAKRKLLSEENPTIRLFETLLASFKFDNNKTISELEAKRILRFIGVLDPIESTFHGDHYQVWGKLPTNNEVKIWTKTYAQDGQDCYGLRFQTLNLRNYIGVNETYIRICKS